jgi:hypothetical protein
MLANQIDGAFQTIDFVFYPVVYDCFLRGRQEQQKQQSGFFCFPLVDFISRSSPRWDKRTKQWHGRLPKSSNFTNQTTLTDAECSAPSRERKRGWTGLPSSSAFHLGSYVREVVHLHLCQLHNCNGEIRVGSARQTDWNQLYPDGGQEKVNWTRKETKRSNSISFERTRTRQMYIYVRAPRPGVFLFNKSAGCVLLDWQRDKS